MFIGKNIFNEKRGTMKFRKFYLLLMLMIMSSQIFSTTVFNASELVTEMNKSEVASENISEDTETNKEDIKEPSLLPTPSTREGYDAKSEDGIVADVGNLRDGTASWNDQDGPGWDTGEKNGIVRTFDTVSYRVDFSYNNAQLTSKDVIIRAIAPEGDYTWQTEPLIALKYDVTDNGDGSIDIRLPDVVAGSGAQTEIALFVGEQRNGDTFKPVFEFYLEDTTGEPVTVLDQVSETTVSAISSINVVLNVMGSPDASAISTHTLKVDGENYGRQYLGYELQLMKVPENNGTIKGMELPDPSIPLEFTIDLDLKYNVSGTVTSEPFYIHDIGYNNDVGFLEGTTIDHQNITYYLHAVELQKARNYPFASNKGLRPANGRYVENSGVLEVSLPNGDPVETTNFLDRQYDSLKISFTEFSGIKINSERELRSDGSVPFATGGINVVSKLYANPKEKYTLTYTAEAKMSNDVNVNDNKVSGVRTIDPVGTRTWLLRRPVSGSTVDEQVNGLTSEVLGNTSDLWSQVIFTGHYIDSIEMISSTTVIDPRAFSINDNQLSSATLSKYGVQIAFDDIYGQRTYNHDDGYQTLEYGVVDFSQFGDILDPKYYENNPGITITTGGATENIDPIEQYIIELDGDESVDAIKWFATKGEAEQWASENEGWYLSAYKNSQDFEAMELSTNEYERVHFTNLRSVTLLNNEYTRYLFEHSETAIWATAHIWDYKDDSGLDTEVINSKYYTENPSFAHYGELGYRKTVYDDNGDLVAAQYPSGSASRVSSTLPIGAKPTIKKTVTGINGESLGASSIVVPGVDEGVRWNLDVALQSPFEIIEDTPLTVTDTVPAGLELDLASIGPKTDPERGIEMNVTTNANGQKVITWTFTSELAREEFKNLTYVTYVDPMAENNITYTETATADFLLDQYQAESEAGVLTQLRAGLAVKKDINKTVIMQDETDLEYTLTYRNTAGPGTTEDYKLYDSFPNNNDGRGTKYAGSMKLKSVEIDHADPGVELKYTFDQGINNGDILRADFKTEAEWTALGKNIEDATGIYVWLPNVEANVIGNVKLTFDTNGNNPQDLLVNNFRMSYEFNGTTFPLISNQVMSSVPGITKEIGKTEDGEFGGHIDLQCDSADADESCDEYFYKIDVLMPKVSPTVELDAFSVTDQIKPELDVLSVKLIDKDGNDVTEEYGDVTTVDNLVTYDFNRNLFNINGEIVSLYIQVKVKPDVENFDMYPDGKLPNSAKLNIIGEEIETPEVTVEPVDTEITKVVADETGDGAVAVGETLTYTLEVTNSHDADALKVAVRDSMLQNLPSFAKFNNDVKVVGSGYSGNLTDGTLVLDKVAGKGAVTITYSITIVEVPVDTATLVNVATDNGEDPETIPPETCDETDCDSTETPILGDTKIVKSMTDENGNGIVEAGEVLTYKLEVTNYTINEAKDVVVRDNMIENTPSWLTFNDDVVIEREDISYTGTLADSNLTFYTIAGNETVTITYSLTVADVIPEEVEYLVNIATDNGEDPDTLTPETCEEQEIDCDSTTNPLNAKVTLAKTVADENNNGKVDPSETLTYTITVTNPNTHTSALDVIIRDSMLESVPEWLTFNNDITIDPSDLVYTGELTTEGITFEEIASEQVVTITYTLTAVDKLPTDVPSAFNLVTSSGEDPLDPDACLVERECVEVDLPVAGNTIIEKELMDESGDGLVEAGEKLTYKLTVTNYTDNETIDVVVRDSLLEKLPSWLTYNDDLKLTDGIVYSGDLISKDLVIDSIQGQEVVEITYSLTASADIPANVEELNNIATDNGQDPNTVDPEVCEESEEDCSIASARVKRPMTIEDTGSNMMLMLLALVVMLGLSLVVKRRVRN